MNIINCLNRGCVFNANLHLHSCMLKCIHNYLKKSCWTIDAKYFLICFLMYSDSMFCKLCALIIQFVSHLSSCKAPCQQYTHHYGEVDQQSAYKNTWCIKITTNIRIGTLRNRVFPWPTAVTQYTRLKLKLSDSTNITSLPIL